MKEINFPEEVGDIDERAFEGCTALKTLVIPGKSEWIDIGEGAFRNCTSLKEVSFSDNVYLDAESLRDWFQGCTSLERVLVRAKRTKDIAKNFIIGKRKVPVICEGEAVKSTAVKNSDIHSDRYAKFPKSEKGIEFYSDWGNERDNSRSYFSNTELNEICEDLSKYMKYNCKMRSSSSYSGGGGGVTYLTVPGDCWGMTDLPDDAKGTKLVFEFYAIDSSPAGADCIVSQLEGLLASYPVVQWVKNNVEIQLIVWDIDEDGDGNDIVNAYYQLGHGFIEE